MTTLKIIFAASLGLALSACTATQHRAAVQDDSTARLTVGTVQKKIRVGMSVAEVAEALGAPNIVSTDEKRREIWIYDKIATERVYSTSDGNIAALVLGGGPVSAFSFGFFGSSTPGFTSGALRSYYGRSAGAASSSQGTFTVIIKFDEDMKVRDLAYHESRF
jgi:outer membrane protein assembly factor BamE (lipoprotein component of BamABCDE complex)